MPGSLCRQSWRLGFRRNCVAPSSLFLLAGLLFLTSFVNTATSEEMAVHSSHADRSIMIREHAGWNKDCDGIAPPPVFLFSPPLHGKVCARTEQIKITSMYAGTQGQCIGHLVRGIRLIYQPEVDFAGEDSLLYAVQYPSVLRTISVKVSVVGYQAETLNVAPSDAMASAKQTAEPIPACAELLF